MTGVTLQWASEVGHNGADLEAQKHRNEVEAGSMTSHYFVKWQQPIVNKSGTASTTATGIGTGTGTATGTATGTGTATSPSSTILVLHQQLVMQFW